MEGSFIDTLEELGTTEEEMDRIADELNEDDAPWIKWWQDHAMPEGLQCIEVHMYPTTRAFIERLWEDRAITFKNDDERKKALIICEYILDSMIS